MPDANVDCQLYKSGDCTAPRDGLEGCVFYPFFKQFKSGHDETALLHRELTQEALRNQSEVLKDHRKMISKLFTTIEGNGAEGLKGRVNKLHGGNKVIIGLMSVITIAMLYGAVQTLIMKESIGAVRSEVSGHMEESQSLAQEIHELIRILA